MDAIQLHDREEELVGTVLLKGKAHFSDICDAWDKYLAELENEDYADIYEFAEKNSEICEVLPLEFYQPK